LKDADFMFAQLKEADFMLAQLERAKFAAAQLEGANFMLAQLERANFMGAQLKNVDFELAQLERANFERAQLERANFERAQLEGTNFTNTWFKGAIFRDTRLTDKRGIGPCFANAVGWDEVFLAYIEWSELKTFGEEVIAGKKKDVKGKKKKREVRLNDYRVATRSYRQLATALDAQGLKEEAERFAYRAQVVQWHVLWWHIWQHKQRFSQRVDSISAFLFSSLLALLTGYGYRFRRSFISYMVVLLMFAWLYFCISQATPHPLGYIDAFILSVSDMVGRGFFRQDVTLSDPYAGWSVLEGMIGVFMDVLLISTLTQRLFKK
jgi:Pentapeptide repeats (9 copies)